MKYLFQCAIGPVQDFIASARRSRDLWYGSWLLSELAKAAANALTDDELIFPAPEDMTELKPDSDLTVANKVVAIVSEAPIAVGARVKKAIDARLSELVQEAFQKDNVRGPFDEDLAQRQLTDLVEYYWVGVPLPDGGYDKARKIADAALASRKGTRNFAQFNGEPKPKSSLDGARESVIPESAYPQQKESADVRAGKQRELYQKYGARRGERLSGVDLVKRQGKRRVEIEQKFKSTSHMAAVPFLEMVCREKGAGADQKLLNAISDFLAEDEINAEDKDGSLLYESRLHEWVADEAKLTDVRKRLKMLVEEHSGTKTEPGIYYALLFADGDNMGEAISNQLAYQKHQELSRALSQFSTDARNIIADHQGIPIFSGGDDVLAYLPLHTVLDCVQELTARFVEKMESANLTGKPAPTLSAGIAVVHHLTSLSDVLGLARQAEKVAKAVPGKDALAIIVSKRSGVDRTIRGKRDALYPRLVEMIELLRLGAIGKGVAYELQELARTLSDADLPAQALEKEALRIVDRKRESGGDKKLDERAKKDFTLWLDARTGKAKNGTDGEAINEVTDAKRQAEVYAKVVENLAQEIIIADIFTAALDMAYGPLENEKETISA